MTHLRLALLLNVVLLLLWEPADAHKVTVFAWVEDKAIHTESKFSGGKKVKEGKIEVFDHLNRKVIEGTTDDKGYFAFPIPPKIQGLNVVLTAGMGHSNHWQITAAELEGSTTQAAAPLKDRPHITDAPTGIDTQQLEVIVERAVEKKLAPLRAQLADPAWGLRDIVAGIGYILGLMGLASYLHHRKQKSDTCSDKQTSNNRQSP